MAVEIQSYCGNCGCPAKVTFGGDEIETTLTASGSVVASWVKEIRRLHRDGHVVGLDVEWRPVRVPGSVPGPVAVLQLCADHRCLVFQILHADYVPDALARFLADRRFTFVGVGVNDDAAKLRDGYGLEVRSAVDLRYLAATTMGRPELRGSGLKSLLALLTDMRMEKPQHVRVSNWAARQLTDDQFKYACADAFASYEVGRILYHGEY